jgi:glutamine amidotransferase
MIVVVDYGRGNLFSLGQALRKLGAEPVISDDPTVLACADRIILPGVGAFGDAMGGLRQRGLIEPLREAAHAGTPILCICVGCQLLLTRGEEFGLHDGLDLIPGTVAGLPDPKADDPEGIRIPNVGWRPLDVRKDAPVIGSLRPDDWMYFVHSYAPMVDGESHIAATIRVNGADIPVAVVRGNIVGVQFHPEKSGPAGLRLLARFLEAEIGS